MLKHALRTQKYKWGSISLCSAGNEVLCGTLQVLAPESLWAGQAVLSFLPEQDNSSPSILCGICFWLSDCSRKLPPMDLPPHMKLHPCHSLRKPGGIIRGHFKPRSLSLFSVCLRVSCIPGWPWIPTLQMPGLQVYITTPPSKNPFLSVILLQKHVQGVRTSWFIRSKNIYCAGLVCQCSTQCRPVLRTS